MQQELYSEYISWAKPPYYFKSHANHNVQMQFLLAITDTRTKQSFYFPSFEALLHLWRDRSVGNAQQWPHISGSTSIWHAPLTCNVTISEDVGIISACLHRDTCTITKVQQLILNYSKSREHYQWPQLNNFFK